MQSGLSNGDGVSLPFEKKPSVSEEERKRKEEIKKSEEDGSETSRLLNVNGFMLKKNGLARGRKAREIGGCVNGATDCGSVIGHEGGNAPETYDAQKSVD